MIRQLAISACVLLLTIPLSAQTSSAPAGSPAAEDLCKEGVDPYNPITERGLFIAAAGVDNELTEEEFSAAGGKKKSFVRKFDRWDVLITYDKNGNNTIDWYEADAYRRALRKQVLGVFDANKDSKLAGDERTSANKALVEGKFPVKVKGSGAAKRAGRDRWTRRMREKYDTDGDGDISPDERRSAMRDLREQERKQNLARYDSDGDGQLSDEERQAMAQERTTPWQEAM